MFQAKVYKMKLFLLTHTKELQRKTNTGSLAVKLLGNSVKVVLWERTRPNRELLSFIKEGNIALLYPHEGGETLCETSPYDAYILIDSTWQEAQKIYNRTPYLHDLPKLTIKRDKPSSYRLRRNQKSYGLCTAEIVSELLKSDAQYELAEILETNLDDFMNPNQR